MNRSEKEESDNLEIIKKMKILEQAEKCCEIWSIYDQIFFDCTSKNNIKNLNEHPHLTTESTYPANSFLFFLSF